MPLSIEKGERMSTHFAIMLDVGRERQASIEMGSTSPGDFQTTVYQGGSPFSVIAGSLNASRFGTTRTSAESNLFNLTQGSAALVKANFPGGTSCALLRQDASDSAKLRVIIPPTTTALGTAFSFPACYYTGARVKAYVGNPGSSQISASLRYGSDTGSTAKTYNIGEKNFAIFTMTKSAVRAYIITTGAAFVQLLYSFNDGSCQSQILLPG
jgi:hypothetical protein